MPPPGIPGKRETLFYNQFADALRPFQVRRENVVNDMYFPETQRKYVFKLADNAFGRFHAHNIPVDVFVTEDAAPKTAAGGFKIRHRRLAAGYPGLGIAPYIKKIIGRHGKDIHVGNGLADILRFINVPGRLLEI